MLLNVICLYCDQVLGLVAIPHSGPDPWPAGFKEHFWQQHEGEVHYRTEVVTSWLADHSRVGLI